MGSGGRARAGHHAQHRRPFWKLLQEVAWRGRLLSGSLCLSLHYLTTLPHTANKPFQCQSAPCAQSLLGPSCWMRHTPVLSPSQRCASYNELSQWDLCGTKFSGTRRDESGSPVSEQEEQWKVCSLRPWGAGSGQGSQASRAPTSPPVNSAKAGVSVQFMEPKSTGHKMESQTDQEHHPAQPPPPNCRES